MLHGRAFLCSRAAKVLYCHWFVVGDEQSVVLSFIFGPRQAKVFYCCTFFGVDKQPCCAAVAFSMLKSNSCVLFFRFWMLTCKSVAQSPFFIRLRSKVRYGNLFYVIDEQKCCFVCSI